jgi:uncharacterized membrane protein HdeD (DUF308 family)
LPRGIHRESINWAIAFSIALIIVGFLALLAPFFAGAALEIVIAWFLILAGVSHLILAWHVRRAGSHLWEALIGAAYIVAGLYLFFHPLAGLIGLTFILSIYLFIKGLFELFAGLSIRGVRGSGWILFDAVFSIVLAIIIWRQLPFAASWVIGTLMGLAVLFTGVTRLALALHARRAIPILL